MSEHKCTVHGINPNVREVECCFICKHFLTANGVRLECAACETTGYLTYANWICDDFERCPIRDLRMS